MVAVTGSPRLGLLEPISADLGLIYFHLHMSNPVQGYALTQGFMLQRAGAESHSSHVETQWAIFVPICLWVLEPKSKGMSSAYTDQEPAVCLLQRVTCVVMKETASRPRSSEAEPREEGNGYTPTTSSPLLRPRWTPQHVCWLGRFIHLLSPGCSSLPGFRNSTDHLSLLFLLSFYLRVQGSPPLSSCHLWRSLHWPYRWLLWVHLWGSEAWQAGVLCITLQSEVAGKIPPRMSLGWAPVH